MRVLLIYEAVPEATTLYLLKELSDEEMSKLVSCHGRYGGLSGNDSKEPVETWLYEWLAGKQDAIVWSTETRTGEKNSPITIESPCVVIHTGFIL